MKSRPNLATIREPAFYGLIHRHKATKAQRRAAQDAQLLYWRHDPAGLVPTPGGHAVLEALRETWAPSMLCRALASQGEPGEAATSAGVARAGIALHELEAAEGHEPEAS